MSGNFDVNKIINESLKETIESDPPEVDETIVENKDEKVDTTVEEEGIVSESDYTDAKKGISAFLESVDDGKKE